MILILIFRNILEHIVKRIIYVSLESDVVGFRIQQGFTKKSSEANLIFSSMMLLDHYAKAGNVICNIVF